MLSITATEKPKWHNFRWRLSNSIVRLAMWVYPENPEVKAFFMKSMIDQMIYGQAVIMLNPETMSKPIKKDKKKKYYVHNRLATYHLRPE